MTRTQFSASGFKQCGARIEAHRELVRPDARPFGVSGFARQPTTAGHSYELEFARERGQAALRLARQLSRPVWVPNHHPIARA